MHNEELTSTRSPDVA